MIGHIDYHSKSQLIAFTSINGRILFVFNLANGKCLHKVSVKEPVTSLKLDSKGKRLFYGASNGSIHTMKISSGKMFEFKKAHSGGVLASDLRRDKDWLVTAGEDSKIKTFSGD